MIICVCNQLVDFVINTLNLTIGKFSVIRQTQVRNVNMTLSCAFVTFNRMLDLQVFSLNIFVLFGGRMFIIS